MSLRDELHKLLDTILDGHESGDPVPPQAAHDTLDGIIDQHEAQAPPATPPEGEVSSTISAGDEPAPPSPEQQAAVNPNVPGGDVARLADGTQVMPGGELGAPEDETPPELRGLPEPGTNP